MNIIVVLTTLPTMVTTSSVMIISSSLTFYSTLSHMCMMIVGWHISRSLVRDMLFTGKENKLTKIGWGIHRASLKEYIERLFFTCVLLQTPTVLTHPLSSTPTLALSVRHTVLCTPSVCQVAVDGNVDSHRAHHMTHHTMFATRWTFHRMFIF